MSSPRSKRRWKTRWWTNAARYRLRRATFARAGGWAGRGDAVRLRRVGDETLVGDLSAGDAAHQRDGSLRAWHADGGGRCERRGPAAAGNRISRRLYHLQHAQLRQPQPLPQRPDARRLAEHGRLSGAGRRRGGVRLILRFAALGVRHGAMKPCYQASQPPSTATVVPVI